MKQKKEDNRPVISFRVSKSLKEKILNVYGDFKPLEHILEDHFFKNKITPPSVIREDNRWIKELNRIISEYKQLKKENHQMIDELKFRNKQIDKKIKKLEGEITVTEEKNKTITENVKLINVEDNDRLIHSINEVTRILEENKKLREQRPTPPVPKKVIKLYSDNCNMSLKKFMKYIPDDLHKCVKI